jgi:hypothetical protein
MAMFCSAGVFLTDWQPESVCERHVMMRGQFIKAAEEFECCAKGIIETYDMNSCSCFYVTYVRSLSGFHTDSTPNDTRISLSFFFEFVFLSCLILN